jgi:hypothetical protein
MFFSQKEKRWYPQVDFTNNPCGESKAVENQSTARLEQDC